MKGLFEEEETPKAAEIPHEVAQDAPEDTIKGQSGEGEDRTDRGCCPPVKHCLRVHNPEYPDVSWFGPKFQYSKDYYGCWLCWHEYEKGEGHEAIEEEN